MFLVSSAAPCHHLQWPARMAKFVCNSSCLANLNRLPCECQSLAAASKWSFVDPHSQTHAIIQVVCVCWLLRCFGSVHPLQLRRPVHLSVKDLSFHFRYRTRRRYVAAARCGAAPCGSGHCSLANLCSFTGHCSVSVPKSVCSSCWGVGLNRITLATGGFTSFFLSKSPTLEPEFVY